MFSLKSLFYYSTYLPIYYLSDRRRMNFDVHSDDIEIVKQEMNTQTSVINLEEIDRIIDPRSLTKHKCVMNKVNEIHDATERCTFKRPAYLHLDRICLHYVMHYIKRYRGLNSKIKRMGHKSEL